MMNNMETKWYKEKGENGVSLLEALNKALDEVYNSKPNLSYNAVDSLL